MGIQCVKDIFAASNGCVKVSVYVVPLYKQAKSYNKNWKESKAQCTPYTSLALAEKKYHLGLISDWYITQPEVDKTNFNDNVVLDRSIILRLGMGYVHVRYQSNGLGAC